MASPDFLYYANMVAMSHRQRKLMLPWKIERSTQIFPFLEIVSSNEPQNSLCPREKGTQQIMSSCAWKKRKYMSRSCLIPWITLLVNPLLSLCWPLVTSQPMLTSIFVQLAQVQAQRRECLILYGEKTSVYLRRPTARSPAFAPVTHKESFRISQLG